MRPDGVVVNAPRFDLQLRVGQDDKPVVVQALLATLAVEALDERVLDQFAGANETERHVRRIGPCLQPATGKLGPVIQDDRLRQAGSAEPLEHARDA
jgi:hypothetical protein